VAIPSYLAPLRRRTVRGLKTELPNLGRTVGNINLGDSLDEWRFCLLVHKIDDLYLGQTYRQLLISMPHDHHHNIPSELALRVKALETALVNRGYVRSETLDVIVDTYENKVGPRNGAQVIARAWSDPEYKGRLLENGTAAMEELGFGGIVEGTDVTVVENKPGLHNMVVCTLCSCYPWALLGLPPGWYKSFAYRSRVVSEPRAVLGEFGVELTEDTEVRVWDSTAELRYLVMPERPSGTEELEESDLADLVTRNGMIGTALL
jgi:nitrile hydratase